MFVDYLELEVAFKSSVEPNKVLIVIIILIVIDAKGAQAMRAAGQPVVAGLVLRSQCRRGRCRSGRYRRGYDASPTRMAAPFASGFARL